MYGTSNYVNPGSALAMVIVFPILSALGLTARLYSHYLNGERLFSNIDTYFAIGAFVFVLACSILLGVAWDHQTFGYNSPRQAGFGGVAGIQLFELVTYIFTEFWVVGITCAKACFLFLYRRLMGYGQIFLLCDTILITLVFAWGTCFFLLNLLQCGRHFNDLKSGHAPPFENTQCINVITVLFASSVSDCALDLAIILLPMPTVWSLQMRTRTKVGVTAIFALGAICIVVSALRLVSWAALWVAVTHERPTVTILGVNDQNDFGSLSTMLFWSQIELGVASIVCNLPCIRPVFTKTRMGRFLRVLRSKVSLSSLRARATSSKKSSTDNSVSTGQNTMRGETLPYGVHNAVAATAEKIQDNPDLGSGGDDFYRGHDRETQYRECISKELTNSHNIVVHTNISTYTEPSAGL